MRTRAHSRGSAFPSFAAVVGALGCLLLAFNAPAQTTSGNSGTGLTLWNNNCVGCHGASSTGIPAAKNAANAGGIIAYAIGQGMTGPLPGGSTDYNDIAAYLATLVTNPSPGNQAVAFQSSVAVSANEIYYPTTWGALNSLVSATPAPAKGTISIDSSTKQITYTAGACQTGSDTVRYRGSGSGGTTDIRSFTVSIAGPTTGPTITSSATHNAQTGVATTYTTTYTPNCPSLTTFGASGLPPGLSINTTGVVSGTPTTVGTYNATISATQNGHTTNFGVTFNVTLGPPVITSAATASGAAGFAFSYQITATNSPTGYSATGLPPGLTVDTTTGLISGTPTSSGTFTPTVSATNGTGTGNQVVTMTIAVGVPAITSSLMASGQTGQSFTYQITATNSPTSYNATGLPAGLTVNTSTGVISGTPTTIASTNVTISATNGTGTGSATLTINVTLGPPVITSPSSASGAAGQAFSYQITASQNPTSFNATGLPSGLSVDTTTGLISGTPTVGGTFNATISATNATGTGSAPLTLNIALFPPVVTSPTTASGQTGVPFTYQITAANSATSYGATGLPTGLTVNTSTGLISGTPTTAGAFNATVSATNGAGTGTQAVTFTISLGPPVITSASTAGGAQTLPFSYQITATNSPTNFAATGLPPGLSVNASTGLISGSPTTTGTFNVTISATNATGTGSATLTITIGVGPPVITSATSASATFGVAFSYQIVATNGPTGFGVGGSLPPGLAFNATTGIISGTPNTLGSFAFTIQATNAAGTGSAPLTINVVLGAPQITSATTAAGTIGQPFSYNITATNNPTMFGATGLPPGLAVNTGNGVISGTPTTGGTFTATITASNTTSTVSQTLTITIAFLAPTASNLTVSAIYETPVTITLPVGGAFTQVTIVTPPSHGTLTAPAANSAAVIYTPAAGYSGADSFTYSVTGPGGTSNVATVSITVGTLPPVAAALAMTVQLNSAMTVDLRSFITGSGITGVAVATPAAHGTVAVNGTRVTYTPQHDFFGSDSFTYVAFGNAGASAPALVTVTVIGRADPTRDANVIGVVSAHSDAAQRFARAQIGNFQQRLESLHARAPEPPAEKAASSSPVLVASAGATPPIGAVPAATGPLSSALASSFLSLAASQSLGVNAATGNGAPMLADGVNAWLAGTVRFGHRDPVNGAERIRFTTDGVSAGIDKRFGRLALGLGLGFARDRTDIGADGSKSDADGTAVALYGSFQPGARTFVDGLLGYASLDIDSDRFVGLAGDFARSRRKGDQWFASISAGYEHRHEGLLVSPYARLDYASTRLKQATEQGAGANALTYFEQTVPLFQATLGVRAESQHETRFGAVQPRARIELSHDFEGDRDAPVAYADEFGTRYTVTRSGVKRNALLLGIGSDFVFGGGLRLGIDYQARRTSHADIDQGIRLQLTQALDGKGLPRWFGVSSMFEDPLRVEAGYVYDDNLTRARQAHDKLADHIFTVNVNKGRIFSVNANTRVVASAFVAGEELYRYTGLGRASAGVQAELQYRSSGDFDAVTLGLQGRVAGDYYDTPNRRGHRYSLALSARQSLTDRIEAFAALTGNVRYGKSAVFDLKDYGAKVNLDYALGGRNGAFYLAGEYRRGDTVSSGRFSLDNIDIAEAFTPDDAFGPGFFAYRFDAKTWLGTIGYNRPLGARDAIDFSWRRVQSTPLDRPSWAVPGAWRYIDNQYSIIYLMRF